MKKRMLSIGVVCLVSVWIELAAQVNSTGVELLKRCAANFDGIMDYTVNLTAELDMERVRVPAMQITLYYKAPNRYHFESTGFAMLPREGLTVSPRDLVDRYDAVVRGEEVLGKEKTIKLQLLAKDPSVKIQQLFVWVDPERNTIMKTESTSYPGRTVSAKLEYALLEGRFWLPVAVEAEFVNAAEDTTASIELSGPAASQLQEFRRPPRQGSVRIRYSNYRINTGLSDDLFESKSKREES